MNYLEIKKKAILSLINQDKEELVEGVPPLTLYKQTEGIATDYKIYGNSVQNGAPAPDNPVEIQSIGTLTTKNLFSGFIKGIRIHSEDGTEGKNSKYASSDYIPVDFSTNTNYSISGLPSSRTTHFIAAYNTNKEFLGRTEDMAVSSRTLSSDSFTYGTAQGTGDTSYLRVHSYLSVYDDSGTVIGGVDELDVQLEIGSVTEYEPYHKYDIPIILSGKNLINPDEIELGGLAGVTGLNFSATNRIRVGFLPVKEGKEYIISGNSFNFANCHIYNSNKEKISTVNLKNGLKIIEGGKYVRFSISKSSDEDFTEAELEELKQSLMVEEGTTATKYEPYKECKYVHIYLDEPLRKVDYIDFKNKKVVRNTFKFIIDENSNISNTIYTYNNTNGIIIHGVLNLPYTVSRLKGLCTYSNKVGKYFDSGSIWCGVDSQVVYLIGILDELGLSTVDEFKTWLSSLSTPFEVICEIPQSIEESITVPDLLLREGTNIIDIDNTNFNLVLDDITTENGEDILLENSQEITVSNMRINYKKKG